MVSSGKKKSIIKQSAESGADSSQSTLVLRDRLWSGPSPSPVLGSVGKWRVSFHPTSSVGSGSDCSHPTPSPLKNTKQTPITAVSIYVKTNPLTSLIKPNSPSLLCQFMSKQTCSTALSIYINTTPNHCSVNLCQKQITHHCSVNLCQKQITHHCSLSIYVKNKSHITAVSIYVKTNLHYFPWSNYIKTNPYHCCVNLCQNKPHFTALSVYIKTTPHHCSVNLYQTNLHHCSLSIYFTTNPKSLLCQFISTNLHHCSLSIYFTTNPKSLLCQFFFNHQTDNVKRHFTVVYIQIILNSGIEY